MFSFEFQVDWSIFAPMNIQQPQNFKWSENVIIIDGDYVDRVAFNLIVNFERMLNRKIPSADFSQWIVDVSLDGNLRPGKHETQVIILHDENSKKLENFVPSDYETEFNGQAFNDDVLGEFIINTIATGNDVAQKNDVMLDLITIILPHNEVRRMMMLPDTDDHQTLGMIRNALRPAGAEKEITLFGMQPFEGGNFKQQVLGYSLMDAMGIKASELEKQ